MSNNLIDLMTEREAKHLLNDLCSVFNIAGKERTPSAMTKSHITAKLDCMNVFVKNLKAENEALREKVEWLEGVLKNIAIGNTPWLDGYHETSAEVFMEYARQALDTDKEKS